MSQAGHSQLLVFEWAAGGEGLLTPAVSQAWPARLATHSALGTDVQGGRQKVRLFWDLGHDEDQPSPCWGLSSLYVRWGLWGASEAAPRGQGHQHRKHRSPRPSVVEE